MTYFKLIEANVDVTPMLEEIASVPNAWSLNQGRQNRIKVQSETLSIPIRGLRKSKIAGRKQRDVHESRFTTISKQFPVTRATLVDIASKLNGDLSRAKLVQLPPGHKVHPHIDRGEYYKVRDRYHLVLKSEPGNRLNAGDESRWLKPGELWWFDNKAMHDAENASPSPRVHFIFDLLPR